MEVESAGQFQWPEQILPELREGTQVYLNNREHQFNLEQGVIIDRTHRHYRVKFSSMDDRIADKCLWLPEHWVEPLPNELQSKNEQQS